MNEQRTALRQQVDQCEASYAPIQIILTASVTQLSSAASGLFPGESHDTRSCHVVCPGPLAEVGELSLRKVVAVLGRIH